MNKKILIVIGDYYKDISSGLLKGAIKILKENQVEYDTIHVPGAFEIPIIIKHSIKKNIYDGYIALGCIIRGETYHFEIIANEVTRKIMDLSININKPIGFGILTCENLDQAQVRSDPNKKNKGAEVAKACLDILLDEQ